MLIQIYQIKLGTTLFPPTVGQDHHWSIFINSPLGQLYKTIPFQALAAKLPKRQHSCGRKPRFSPEGGIALQVLKHYYKVSDDKLIELLNGSYQLQYFCGIRLRIGEKISDGDVVSRWRMLIGEHLSWEQWQSVLVQAWKADLEQTQTNLADATCVESYIRYPTDVKLLWESVLFLRSELHSLCRSLKFPFLRTKYRDIKKATQVYLKRKRKTHQQTRRIKKRLLNLLVKLLEFAPVIIGLWKQQAAHHLDMPPLKQGFMKKLSTIKKVCHQQQILFERPTQTMPDRIVSLAKPYVHPIVRGKENKRVEFGMKLHLMQIDGVNFIEHASWQAFHEGVRLKKTIWRHRLYFRTCLHFGGDRIYANNANRKYCSNQQIFTSFVPKGRKAKDEKEKKQLRRLIAKERATRLEGSFGTAKNHYLLDKVKARNQKTELTWIFFGFLTANAQRIKKKREPPPL